jgi:hypothetical protein
VSETSPEQPEPGVGGTPSKAHGDPLLDAAQGRGDGNDGSRQGPDPAEPDQQ